MWLKPLGLSGQSRCCTGSHQAAEQMPTHALRRKRLAGCSAKPSSWSQSLERVRPSRAHSSRGLRPTVTRLPLVATSYCASAAFYKKLPYRPIEDIRAISLISEAPYVLATFAE